MDTEEYNAKSLQAEWYCVVNDLIGGWSISTVNTPLSQHDHRPESAVSVLEIADTYSQEIAQHIVQLHNSHRDV